MSDTGERFDAFRRRIEAAPGPGVTDEDIDAVGIEHKAAWRARPARQALRYNLVFRRAQLKLTQDALADAAGITRADVAAIEQGTADPTLTVLERLAVALDTTAPKLLTSIRRGNSDAEIAQRRFDPPENFVDGRDFLAALAENYE